MVHGTPDWGGSSPKITTYKLDDHAELAARLGSIVTFERRGDVIALEDFSQGGGMYNVGGIGVGEAGYLSCGGALSGGLCLALESGIGAGSYEEVYRYQYAPVVGGIGMEIWVSPDALLDHLIPEMIVYDGANQCDYQVRYNHLTGKLSVWDAGGVWRVIGTPGVINIGYGIYTPIKMVVDTGARQYVRVLFGDKAYDASAHGGRVTASAIVACLLARCAVYSVVPGGAIVKVDNWILTQNEPVT
jgi:hypothetical protein